jgi:hypothetical protein
MRDPDPLSFAWFANGSPMPFATGAVAAAVFDTGSHSVNLRVSDPSDDDNETRSSKSSRLAKPWKSSRTRSRPPRCLIPHAGP